MTSPLTGAWEGGSENFVGMIVCTDRYLSMFIITKDRKLFDSDRPSVEEMAEAWRTMLGAAGPYTLSGSTLRLERRYGRNPNLTTVLGQYDVTIDGDELTIIPEPVVGDVSKASFGETFVMQRIG